MATRREIYAAEAERKENGAMLRVRPMGDGVLPQYSNDVKVERTSGGIRATVHAYGDNEVEVRERAIRLFFDSEDDIAMRRIVPRKKQLHIESEMSDEVRRVSNELNEELTKEK